MKTKLPPIFPILLSLIVFFKGAHSKNCNSNVCFNDGVCVVSDDESTFYCDCKQEPQRRYSGTLCETVINCGLKCLNGGSCVFDNVGHPQCNCTNGYAGDFCTDKVEETTSGDCQITGCMESEICLADPTNSEYSCEVDYCKEQHPCKNNASCRPSKGGYLCECLLGYTGPTCEDDLNECDFGPCKNNGTCHNTVGSYKCECKPGFAGELCSEQIGFCLPNPCGDHGSCLDLEEKYECVCQAGYTGQWCETKVECSCENPAHQCTLIDGQPHCECPPGSRGENCGTVIDACAEKNECQNGGKCIANGNKTFCICPSRYSGHFCEHEIDEECLVEGKKCENHGICLRFGQNDSRCQCSQNFSGKWCEVLRYDSLSTVRPGNITARSCPDGFIGDQCNLECDCHENEVCQESMELPGTAECLRVANESGIKPTSPTTHENIINTTQRTRTTITPTSSYSSSTSPRTESTTLTSTSMPTKGPFFPSMDATNISSCDECAHAQKCLKIDGRFQCICQPGYSGSVCDLPIQPCQTLRCSNGQICRLRRTRKGDIPFCACPPGLSGPNCQTPTTATFKSSSIFLQQTPQMLPNVRSGSQSYSLEFSFRTTVPNVHFASGETILGQIRFSVGLSQGQLALNLSSNHIYGVLDVQLNDADWYSVKLVGTSNGTIVEVLEAGSGYLLARRAFVRQDWGIYTTRIGRRDGEGYMIGCLRDVAINQQAVDLFDPERSIDVESGCVRKEQCTPGTCQNSADCIDLWSEHRCECLRPFLAPNCLNKLQEATFGHENQSTSVRFSIDKNEATLVRQLTDLSFLIRTNAENGPIIYLGEDGDDDVGTFLSTELVDGKLRVNTRLGGKNVMSKTGETVINDNAPHLVQIMRQNNDIQVLIDGKRELVLTVNWPFEHPLLLDSIVLGDSDVRSDAFTSTAKFLKGTLQDIRLNEKSLLMDDSPPEFHVETVGRKVSSTNLLRGTVSDNVCLSNKCQHGECRNTFNDYECLCEVGWMGKSCGARDYCSSSSCEDGTACVNSHNGFVCVGPATFAPTSSIRYSIFLPERPWITPKENNFTFEIRTRSKQGNVFKLQGLNEVLWLELGERRLTFGYTNTTSTIEDPLAFDLADGQWHTIAILMQSNGKLYASFDNASTVPLLAPFSFSRFLMDRSARVALGKSYNATGFKGCLRSVRINSLPELSFLRKDNFGGNLEETIHFIPEAREHIRADGCHSREVCGRLNPCKNGAKCSDLFEERACECPSGYEGKYCEININDCKDDQDCHPSGMCVDGLGEKSCVCRPGFSGLRCDQMEDQCAPNPCHNGANCKTIDGEYSCSCPIGFFGHRCQQRQSVNCSSDPCENGATCTDLTQNSILCSCQDGFKGVLCDIPINPCLEMPCRNGGVCSTTETAGYTCKCPIGYAGARCDSFVDTCDLQKPCIHGRCSNIWNGFLCECDEGWQGANCDIPVDFCMEFPCDNNGTCVDAGSSYRCDCAKYYLGNHCEVAGICTTSPCVHGECVQHSPSDYSCNCFRGYRGDTCGEQIDYCAEQPCKNGATCEKAIGDFTCKCVTGFTGKMCEVDIDDCTKDSCAHGVCIDRVNGFDCNCTHTGYMGKRCDVDIDECAHAEVNCIHGLCKNYPGGYECKCFQGFIGPKCNMVNPCLPDAQNRTLHNCVHGQCVNPVVFQQPSGREVTTHECACFDGFEGPQCSHAVEKHRALALGYILGPVAAVLLVLCLLGCMLFFFVARNKRANQGTYSPSTQEMTDACNPQSAFARAPHLKLQQSPTAIHPGLSLP